VGQIKENLRTYKIAFSQLSTVLRVMAFEKFNLVFFAFYIIFALSLSFIVSVSHWGASVIVLFLALVLSGKILKSFQFLKRSLIHKNDRIEYADPSSSDTSDIFKTGTVLLKMKEDEVKKTSLISDELMEGNRHFFLVQKDKKPTVIAYDWIIGLSPELLEEFDDIQSEETSA